MKINFNALLPYQKTQNRNKTRQAQIRFNNNAVDMISFGEKKDIEYTPLRNGAKINTKAQSKYNPEDEYDEGYRAGYKDAEGKMSAMLDTLNNKMQTTIAILSLVSLSTIFNLFYEQGKIEELQSAVEELKEENEDGIEDLIKELPANYESRELKERLDELIEDYKEYIENNQ